jgi:hypothetical protein
MVEDRLVEPSLSLTAGEKMAIPSVLELAESEKMLPTQFFPGGPDIPEKALMRAVLQRALDDLSGVFAITMGPRPRTRLRAETEEWFLSEDDTYLYSFASICQALGLNAGAVRRALFSEREAA